VRGYRVVGRGWGIYPISVATFRLGPKFFWRWLDTLIPFGWESGDIRALGNSFARGVPAGLPFVLWPSPLPVLGFLVDNRWLNRFVYRNHAYKHRCDGCGICVAYCPVGRLKLVDKRPVATGTCTLCLGCINHCPTGAMQMWFFSEYGQPYWTRFSEYVVRTRRRAGGLTPGRRRSSERRRSMDGED
jgi:ferredoxin